MTTRGPDFRDHTIEGDGLLLRALGDLDLPMIVDACNDPDVQRWIPLPSPYTADDARWFVQEHAPSLLASGAGIERAIEVDGRFAGVIGLHATDWVAGKSEAGYWLAPWARGRRVTARALTAITDWAFDAHGLHRMAVLVCPDNAASLGVARSAGFIEEGTLRQAGHTRGGLVDLTVLARLASDPRPPVRSGG